ncbi:MAG: aryl-sulfate sulfotransferase [Candidatus Thermoplasmatota archaeon]|nr:aryl-sulfate sulfotransferase [Candidatus Thermoplasmatota archaeon]MBU1940213.1 aryl-sulfate sulfotransferase [Candidatus Thermoplasmatota archaeon]
MQILTYRYILLSMLIFILMLSSVQGSLPPIQHLAFNTPIELKTLDGGYYQHKIERNHPQSQPISSPYLTIRTINDGFGLTIVVENIGEQNASNITVEVTVTGGLSTRLPDHIYTYDNLVPGDSLPVLILPKGVGLGIFTDSPILSVLLSADATKTRGKTIHFRHIGHFVRKIGEYWNSDEIFQGYTLYSPMISPYTFLINNSGTILHSWESSYKPALSVYLLEDGSILRTALSGFNPRFWGGGLGGMVQRFDWNNTLLWSFRYTDSNHCLHHDIEPLPNGNVLMISWEYRSAAEAIANGRDPNGLGMGELWPDHIIEVMPTGSTTGEIVWEWHLWDHLIQDLDPSKQNYGVVADHPELVDINEGAWVLADWTHCNSIDYNPKLDQILISVLRFNEIWIIDHSTTTEEAAGHTGGLYGHGGDLLYRWGNPQVYQRGSAMDQQLFQQHDAEWIPQGYPGEGNIIVFNNGRGRPEGDYSTVDELQPPLIENGSYYLTSGEAYGPDGLVWQYIADDPFDLYAINLAGAQRLPNGNTIICDGPHGFFFEVTEKNEIVWEYVNPEPSLFNNHVFRVTKYPPDYPGLQQLFS